MKVIKHQTEKNVGYIISESPKTTIDKDTAMFLKNVTNLKIVIEEKDGEVEYGFAKTLFMLYCMIKCFCIIVADKLVSWK